MKKVFAGLLVFVLLLTGCSTKKEEKNVSSSNIKGRYVETDVSLPEEFDKSTVLQLTKKNGMPFLYAFSSEDALTITGYQMNNDGSWTEDTPEWLQSDSLLKAYLYEPEVFEDTNGNQFLYYLDIEEDSYKANLFRSTDGTTYDIISPEGWNELYPESDNYYITPRKVTVMEDGTLAALFSDGEISFYDKVNFLKQKSITGQYYVETILTAADKSLILGQTDNHENLVSIDVYDTTTYNKTSYPYQSDFKGYTSTYFDINDKKEMALCDTGGIHVLEEGTSTWQTIVDGTLTSLSMSTMWTMGFVSGSDSNYYILYNSKNGCSLMKYSYDKSVDTVPSTELTIYSLKESATLRQAAAVFHKTYPDVKINFTIAMTDDEYRKADRTAKEDYIRALNTELLAGNGPDILVLNELPADSFVEKGVLTDISDIIQPMIDKGELYPDIMKNYIKDDKIYYVPARFNLQLLCARTPNAQDLSTLENLADYAVNHMDKTLFGSMALEDFITTFAPYITNKILNNDGKINKEKLVSELETLKSIGDNIGIIDEYTGDDKYMNHPLNLTDKIELNLSKCGGFNDAIFPIGIVELIKGSYTVFENSFTSSCELGINQASKSQELAKEFISLVLSEKIQKDDFYDGFSINKKGLILNSQEDRSNYALATGITTEDGKDMVYTFEALNKEQMEQLIQNCSKASNRIIKDEPLLETLKEETKEFFQGNLSAEETANLIIQKANVYLSE
ncbi:extracellular solute-binding protein [Anaerocolumna aminovalerica]|uniref:extracellular solute-binding protein n=1 Tax=Anaerocolumna aminovalerica TaxID=1527 RepID=UPI000BE49141|nr:extracellular solute-binding protein [Anaerocolumna aminovalerica]